MTGEDERNWECSLCGPSSYSEERDKSGRQTFTCLSGKHEENLLRAQRDELRDLLEAVLPYAVQFWRSGEQPASCIAEARAAIARIKEGR